SALTRLAARGNGAVSQDLARVNRRIRQGLSEAEALKEWAATSGLQPVRRLVGVLSLNREAADLGRLIGDEAKTIRREAHQRQIERIERRNQQVWIPVTVAALVPGVVLLAVPFLDALSGFSGS
ncbi:MAG: type II secretion system F family protein, partial [Acidimicrobiales bacterium]|nr:type II secretion system F family protein [Acidimicrobiales bacterium]